MRVQVNLALYAPEAAVNEGFNLEFPATEMPFSKVINAVNAKVPDLLVTARLVKKGKLNLLVNGVQISKKQLKKGLVKDGDVLSFLTPIVGG